MLALRQKNTTAPSSAIPASAPMTIPAMAPPERLELPDAAELVVAGVLVPDGVTDAFEVALFEAVADALDARVVLDDPLATLEVTLAPRTCANVTTPTLLPQQSVLPPQHQRSLVAVPSHGDKAVFPKPPLS